MLSSFKKMKDLMIRLIGVLIVGVFIIVAGLILAVYEEDLNQWLTDSAAARAALIGGSGFVLAGFGFAALVMKKTWTKFGTEVVGQQAIVTGWIMLLGGLGFGIFGIWDLVASELR
mgnify:FL=1